MPWDPVRDLLTMQERLESLFGHAAPGWVPPVDLMEMDNRYVLTVELPGVPRHDVAVEFHEGVLTLSGHRRDQQSCPERYQQLERGQGPFSRSFRFGSPVRSDAITADMADGVLTVVVPKVEVHRINVSESTES